jgi:hypothetical protein
VKFKPKKKFDVIQDQGLTNYWATCLEDYIIWQIGGREIATHIVSKEDAA